MKSFSIISAIILTLMLTASAQELDNSKSVSDLMYLPDSGTWFFQVDAEKADSSSTVEYQSKIYYTSETESTYASYTIGRVFDGNMLLSLTIPYELSSDSSLTYGPAATDNGKTTKTKSIGMGDVKAFMRWRLVEQKDSDKNVDLLLSISPKTGDAESASSTQDGNNFRGGTNYSIGAEVGKKFKRYQFTGEINYLINGSREIEDLSDNSKSKADSFNQLTLAGTAQFMPNDKVFMNMALQFVSMSEFDFTSEGSKTEYDIDSYFQFGIAGGYEISESMVIRIMYASAKVERTITSGAAKLDNELDASSLKAQFLFQF